jgi:hypothetical protein
MKSAEKYIDASATDGSNSKASDADVGRMASKLRAVHCTFGHGKREQLVHDHIRQVIYV